MEHETETSLAHRLLDRVLSLYGDLHLIADRQQAVLDSGDPDRLLTLMHERQTIIDRITTTVEQARRGVPDLDRLITDPAHASLQRKANSIDEIAQKVRVLDTAHADQLGTQRDELAKRLSGVGDGRRAVRAYGNAPTVGPKFQDARG